ncbi:hypothetical protein B7463_g2185, partial [Scytalidium lignicola]
MSSVSSKTLYSFPVQVRPLLQDNRAKVFAASSVLLFAPLLRYVYLDYKAWYNLGISGVSHNFRGWLLQTILQLIAKETLNPEYFDEPAVIAQAGKYGDNSFLKEEDVPQREPPRPVVGYWTVPQRQLNQNPSEEMKERVRVYIKSTASASQGTLFPASSNLEPSAAALFLSPSKDANSQPVYPHNPARKVKGEIGHIHDADGSLHVSLAPKDAKLVIERGWGQRHSLVRMFHPGYMMIYGPRNEEEIAVVEKIIDAGARFMSGGPGNK